MDKPFIFALRNRASGLILLARYACHAPAPIRAVTTICAAFADALDGG